jgi:hypothetical protein
LWSSAAKREKKVSHGEAGMKSDLDFGETRTGRSLLDLIGIKQELEDLLGANRAKLRVGPAQSPAQSIDQLSLYK